MNEIAQLIGVEREVDRKLDAARETAQKRLVNARESRSLEIETALKKASNDSAKRALDAKLGAQKKAQDIILTGDSEARACKESAQRNMQSAVDLIVSRF